MKISSLWFSNSMVSLWSLSMNEVISSKLFGKPRSLTYLIFSVFCLLKVFFHFVNVAVPDLFGEVVHLILKGFGKGRIKRLFVSFCPVANQTSHLVFNGLGNKVDQLLFLLLFFLRIHKFLVGMTSFNKMKILRPDFI